MIRAHRTLVLLAALAAPLVSSSARAGIDACGNIDIQGTEHCEADVTGGCTAKCTPVNFELACHGKLEASCEGQCTATLPSCQTDCEGSCSANCTADPGHFNCDADCESTCEADCSGKCASNANSTECEGSCKATCSSQCSAKCTGTPPSADCNAKCQASCTGSCTGKAQMDCQIKCQSQGFAQCQQSLTGGCQTQCTQPSGALFCDGQFVDTGGNFAACKAAIDDFINAHLQVMASGTSNCSGNTCEAQGQASCKCSRIAPTDATNAGAFTIAGFAAAAIAARRRSRRR